MAIQKAASTTIKHRLTELGVFTLEPKEEHLVKCHPEEIHRTLGANYRIPVGEFVNRANSDGFTFSVIRHPLDRLQSFYRDKVVREGWLDDRGSEFQRLYGVRIGESWPSFLKKVFAVRDRFHNQHIRRFTDTLTHEGKPFPIHLYTTRFLGLWEADLVHYLFSLGALRDNVESNVPRLNQTELSSSVNPSALEIPAGLKAAYYRYYGPDEQLLARVKEACEDRVRKKLGGGFP